MSPSAITLIAFLLNLLIFFCLPFGIVSRYFGAKRYVGAKASFLLGFFLGPLGLLIVFCSNKKEPEFVFPEYFESVPDQIKKYKDLLDGGAITEAEYNQQKEKLLSR